MQVRAAQDHPVGMGLLRYFSQPTAVQLNAPARDILKSLKDVLPEENRFPFTNKLGNELRRIAPGLRHLGIDLSSRRPPAMTMSRNSGYGRPRILRDFLPATMSIRFDCSYGGVAGSRGYSP
jgi:hypothetical protein